MKYRDTTQKVIWINDMMKASKSLLWLSILVALLALITAAGGLFWPGEGSPVPFTTVHGEAVELFGRGLYRLDTTNFAPIFLGTDAVTLMVFIPLLVIFIALYRRGSFRGQLLLTGLLSYFLYNSLSRAIGSAYNPLFLVYILYFSASLFAIIRAFTLVDLKTLTAKISPRFPNRGMAIFLFIAGLSVFVWLIDIIGTLARGGSAPASVASYTTDITAVLDIGIIAPCAYLAGVLLYRRIPFGYLLGFVMISLNATIGLVVLGQTLYQALNGVVLTPGQAIGYVGTFVVTSLFAIGFMIAFLRNVSE